MQPHELREQRITRMICIVLAVIYTMAAYKDIKKGFVDGYNVFNNTAVSNQALQVPNTSGTELDLLPNKFVE